MKVFCILSDERAFRSKSPAMFSAIFKRVGIKGIYVPFKVYPDKVGAAMQSLRVLNIDGANVSVPYKESVISHMDVLSEGANIIGAINTIVRNGDQLKGYNTNAIGFMDAMEEAGFDIAGKTALVFGTGGAAKAVTFIFNWLRSEGIIIAARSREKAEALAHRFSGEVRSLETITDAPIAADIVVNATSVSSPDESPEFAELVSKLNLPNCELLLDLNYGRSKNFWQDLAVEKGIRFMDGLSTLAHQARRCFALWTKIDVEPAEFLKALEDTD